MFAVVEHQQHAACGEGGGQRFGLRRSCGRQAERGGHRGHQQGRIVQRRQLSHRGVADHVLRHVRRQLINQRARQAGLADARSAHHGHHPVLQHRLAQGGKFGSTAEQGRALHRDGRAGRHCSISGRRIWRIRHGRVSGWRCKIDRKAVTASRHRGNAVRSQQLAQRRDLHAEVVFLHHHAGPDELQQFVLADHAVAVLDQAQQQVEGASSQRLRLAATQHSPFSGANLERTEHIVS